MRKSLNIFGKFLGLCVVCASVLTFNSCANGFLRSKENTSTSVADFDSKYGSYLAGRVALSRSDFDAAGKYFAKTLEKDPENKEMLEQIYIILAAQGKIAEASEYAKQAEENGVKGNMLYTILVVDSVVKKNYDDALKYVQKLTGEPYETFLVPLISAWVYAGKQDYEKAVAKIDKIKEYSWLRPIYFFHAGLINDYFGKEFEAQKFYEKILEETPYDLNFRYYRVIMDFYMRNHLKKRAEKLATKYRYEGATEYAQKYFTKAVLSDKDRRFVNITPQYAVADGLIDGAAFLRMARVSSEIEYMFLNLAGYADSESSFLKIMQGEILQSSGMLEAAESIYSQIGKNDFEYFVAQMKIADMHMTERNYKSAERILKNLIRTYPENDELYFLLGDALRFQNKNNEAYAYYKSLLANMPENYKDNWAIYYAMAVVSDQKSNWPQAEEYLLKALELSKRNPLVQNYLGYSWLDKDMNIEKAFAMIADAYNQKSYDPHIIDSVGWAFYKIGDYERAVKYLETATNMKAENALINEHLGDAYWFAGRKNEAIFQWNHAMVMREDADQVDKAKLREKIKRGYVENNVSQNINMEEIQKIIKEKNL